MADKLLVSPAEMRTMMGKLKKEETAFETSIKQMEKIINSLPQKWEGKSSAAYVQQFKDLKPGFSKAKQTVGAIAKQMGDIADIYEKAEADISRKLKAK